MIDFCINSDISDCRYLRSVGWFEGLNISVLATFYSGLLINGVGMQVGSMNCMEEYIHAYIRLFKYSALLKCMCIILIIYMV